MVDASTNQIASYAAEKYKTSCWDLKTDALVPSFPRHSDGDLSSMLQEKRKYTPI